MKKIISSVIIALFLFACALESEFSLPNTEKNDKQLIGTWIANDASGKLIISQNNDNRTLLIKIIDDTNKEEILSKNAFNSTINGYNILNLVHVDNASKKQITTFYGYRITKNKLSYAEVNDKFTDRKFTSSKDLLSYFNENIDKKGFFNDWETPMIKSE